MNKAEIILFSRNKKAWLDFLFYDLGKQFTDYRLTYAYKCGNEFRFAKWLNYLNAQADPFFIKKANQRTILHNELILEHDGSWSDYLQVLKELKTAQACFYAYATDGQRAKHIHMYFDLEFTRKPRKERERLRQVLIAKFGCDRALANDNHMIALEHVPHWKTGEVKKLIAMGDGCAV